ncbi:MAG: dihydrolipoyl dehydrogenase [Sedimentibacter sp.]|uniref:dihydrolipoyl dehydrogenase n=1 Tax=Sedimentibacter sp. TaxID=1960295 RepID=UPI00315921C7
MLFDLIVEKLPGHDTSGIVGNVNKKAGSTVKYNDVIFTIESGKATFDFISKYDGVIESLSIEEGDTVKKNQIVGRISGEKAADADKNPTGAEGSKKTSYTFGLAKPVEKTYEVDVAVIGGGPGGYVAAIRAAQAGLKVLLVEEDRLGGTCLNYGCIPTKSLINSVNVLEKITDAADYGIEIDSAKISMEKIINRKDKVVSTLVSGIEHLLKANKISYIKGKAVVLDEDTVTVKTKSEESIIKFKNLIVAAGSKTFMLPIEGCDDKDILTSKELLELSEIPKSLTIIGGGVIGMEFAFIYQSLGSKVNVIEFCPQVLGNLDNDVIACIKESAVEKGIRIYEGARAVSIKTSLDNSKIVEIKVGDDTQYVTSEKVAVAVGRKANLESLDLDKLNVELNEKRNGIQVDQFMRTSNPKIYAIGDVTNKIQLAHVASHQGIVASDHIAGKMVPMNYDLVPSVIFTSPEVSQVGCTEKEAANRGIDFITGKFPFSANGKALIMGETKGFIKLVAEKSTKKIIGGAIVGVHAADMINVISNLIDAGTTIEHASHAIYAHPTVAESIHEAILGLDKKSIHFVN